MTISPKNGIGATGLNSGEGIGSGGIAGSASGGGVLVVYDSFTDANTTLLRNHTPDTDTTGLGWTAPNNGWNINNNQAVSPVSGDLYAYITNSETTTIHEITRVTETIHVLVGRFIDASNNWDVFFNPSGDTLNIREWDGGATTVRASDTIVADPNSIWMGDDGTTISAGYERNAATISYDSTLHNATRNVGMRGLNTSPRYDDFYLLSGTTDPGDLP